MSKNPTILIVEDQPVLRTGLRLSLETLHNYEVVGEAADGEAAVAEAQRLRPHVILMDIGLPRLDGIEATWKIKKELPHTRIVMFTSRTESDDVTSALGSGADGYCTKETSIEQVSQAIETVMRGEVWLDPAIAERVVSLQRLTPSSQRMTLNGWDMEILKLIRDGKNSNQIAQHLQVDNGKIAQSLHAIVRRFVAQSAQAETVVSPRKYSNEWLAEAIDNHHQSDRIYAEKYLIESLIGAGGMGSVFKAKHMFIDRMVALKLLRRELMEDQDSMRNFQREAKAVASLEHPNVVTVHDFGLTANNEPYIVMEYVPGKDLGSLMETHRRIDPPRLLGLCLQVCAGLAAAHARDIIHCDLKPSNVLISGAEPIEVVKLVDFGLAQIVPRESNAKLDVTEKLFTAGTPLYMSPEQSKGKAIDLRTDIYSLGCMMFEALTGINPFRGESVMDTFAKQINMPPPLISDVHPEGKFPVGLISCINEMLAKDPAARPQSMESVSQTLAGILSQVRCG